MTTLPRSLPTPDISVVLCTFNRAERIERAVRAVLAQEGCEYELLVVDDGSTDATAKVLASIEHDRLRVIRRPNGGLSAARNTGLDAARGAWIVFLDDDDLAQPGWLATFLDQATDPSIGIACCGATWVDPDGHVVDTHHPKRLPRPCNDTFGSVFAGTFAARTDLVRRAGGYLVGLGVSHQTELFVRLLRVAHDDGLGISSRDVAAVRLERRPHSERPSINPRAQFDGTRWILTRHRQVFDEQPISMANYESIAGAAASQVGDWPAARRHLLRALRAAPRSRRRWARVALATVPPVGRRVWDRNRVWQSYDTGRGGLPDQRPGAERPVTGGRELFLPWGYRENPPAAEVDGTGHRHDGVHRLADRLARRRPGLTSSVDVLQRVEDPVALLHRLAAQSGGGPVLLSTPDRAISDLDRQLGPPTNQAHIREWTLDELELLLQSTGFDIERHWRVRRAASMVFLVRHSAA